MTNLKRSETHYSNFAGRMQTGTSDPVDPEAGQMYYDTGNDRIKVYNGSAWKSRNFTTTTSTSSSTSTTTTSTSTTTTSTSTTTTSTSTTTTVSTTTSTSTTTTL